MSNKKLDREVMRWDIQDFKQIPKDKKDVGVFTWIKDEIISGRKREKWENSSYESTASPYKIFATEIENI